MFKGIPHQNGEFPLCETPLPPPSPLALAETCDHFALRICAVDLKNEPLLAAGALIKIKKCLAGAKISVEVAGIKAEPLRDGAKSVLKLTGHLRCC